MKNEITLSKAKKISSVITNENADKWIESAKKLSQRFLEKAVAKVNPKSGVQEGSRFIGENALELRMVISKQTDLQFRRTQDLQSQTLQAALNAYLEKNDPVVKAVKALKKSSKTKKPFESKSEKTVTPSGRTPFAAELKHRLSYRDQGKCQKEDSHSPDGICGDQRWIDFHHLIPVHQGGTNTLENLVTLCRAHHQMEHLE